MKIGVKFFRRIVAPLTMTAVVVTLLCLSLTSASVAVSTDDKPIYKGSANDKVSLMINVYWGTEYVDDMLATLKEKSVKTTFFVGGSWVRDNEEVFRRIVSDGHEIGNHGFFHKDHDKINAARNREEISSAHNLVKELTGIEMRLFAPPSGAFNGVTLEIAKELGYTTIMWSKDTIDWRDKDEDLIYKRATKNAAGGDLVLMHPTKATAAVLGRIIDELAKEGLTVAPVSEVIKPA